MYESRPSKNPKKRIKQKFTWSLVYKGAYSKIGSLQLNGLKIIRKKNIEISLNILGIKGTRHSDIKSKRLRSVVIDRNIADIALKAIHDKQEFTV